MDAGLAAVLGALAGAIGTTLAGLAAGRASREQAEITARSEHRRQRQGPRESVYLELLSAVSSLREHVYPHVFGYEEMDRPPLTAEVCREANGRAQAVRSAWLSVTLAGPQAVLETATEIEHSARQLAHHLQVMFFLSKMDGFVNQVDAHQLTAHEELVTLGQLHDSFTEVAQQALDDDGTV